MLPIHILEWKSGFNGSHGSISSKFWNGEGVGVPCMGSKDMWVKFQKCEHAIHANKSTIEKIHLVFVISTSSSFVCFVLEGYETSPRVCPMPAWYFP